MKIIYIGLVLVFYILYFSKQWQLFQKGIKSNQLGKGTKPKQQLFLEYLLLFVSIAMAFIQFSNIFNLELQNYGLFWFGVILIGVADFFFFSATFSMKDNWRAGIDEKSKTNLVTNGIYQFSRNPAFVAFDLLYLGSACVINNELVWLFVLFCLIVFHLQILQEETFLKRDFGQEYVHYSSKVPRYLFF